MFELTIGDRFVVIDNKKFPFSTRYWTISSAKFQPTLRMGENVMSYICDWNQNQNDDLIIILPSGAQFVFSQKVPKGLYPWDEAATILAQGKYAIQPANGWNHNDIFAQGIKPTIVGQITSEDIRNYLDLCKAYRNVFEDIFSV